MQLTNNPGKDIGKNLASAKQKNERSDQGRTAEPVFFLCTYLPLVISL